MDNLEELYQIMKHKPQSSKISDNIIKTIKNTNKSKYHTLLVLELLRISAPSKIISNKIVETVFQNIYILEANSLLSALNLIATYKIAHLLTEKSFINWLNSNFFKIKIGIHYMEKIILNYIEEKGTKIKIKTLIFELCEKYIKTELAQNIIKNKVFNEFVKTIDDRRLVNIAEFVNELRYVKDRICKRKYLMKIFGDKVCKIQNKENIISNESNEQIKNLCVNENFSINSKDESVVIDNMFGKEYIFGPNERVSCHDYLRLYELYKDDITGKLILARQRMCCEDCIGILKELSNSVESKVRARAVYYLPFDSGFILDVSKEVRNVVFNKIKNEKINDNETLLTLFKGYTTKAGNDYQNVINSLILDFDFIYQNRKELGVKDYLVNKENMHRLTTIIFNIHEVRKSMKKHRFYLKYVNTSILDDDHIKKLIKDDAYGGFLYLSNKSIDNEEYNKLLINSYKSVSKTSHILRIVQFVSPCVRKNFRFEIENVKSLQDLYFYSCFDDVELCDLITIYEKFNMNFAVAFFLSKYAKKYDNIFELVNNYIKSEENIFYVLQILIQSNNKDLLASNFSKIFDINIDNKIKRLFIESTTAISFLLFFFRSGCVKNYNKQFVLETFKIICKGLKEITKVDLAKIRTVYHTYYTILDNMQKVSLVTLATSLKKYSNAKDYQFYQIVNGNICIEKLPNEDKILYTVCDLIKSFHDSRIEDVEEVRSNSFFEVPEKYSLMIESFNFIQ